MTAALRKIFKFEMSELLNACKGKMWRSSRQ